MFVLPILLFKTILSRKHDYHCYLYFTRTYVWCMHVILSNICWKRQKPNIKEVVAPLWKTDGDFTECCRAILCTTVWLLAEPSLERLDGVEHEVTTVFGKAACGWFTRRQMQLPPPSMRSLCLRKLLLLCLSKHLWICLVRSAIRRCLPPRLEVDRCFTSGMRDGCRTSLGGIVARWTQEGKSQRSVVSLVVFVSRLWHQRHAKKGWAILGILASIHYKVNTGLRVLTSIPFTWNIIIIVMFAFS